MFAPDQIGDVVSGRVPILVSVIETGERVGDHFGGGIRGIEQPHQRDGDVLVTELAEGFDDRRPQQFVREQRAQLRRHERAADLTEGLDRGKREKEVALQRNGGQRLAGFDRAQPAKRFDHVKANVDVVIVQAGDERRNGPAIAALPEDQRRLDAKVGVLVVEESDERLDDVDVARRQQIQCAAQHREVAMLRAERAHEGVRDRLTVLRERRDRHLPHLHVAVAEQAGDATRDACRGPRPSAARARRER